MSTARGSRAVLARLGAVGVALAVVSLLTVNGSRAAFTDTTGNAGNTWSAGTVDLRDDDSDAVLFTVAAMKPGDTSTRCITVTYDGSLPADVKLYAAAGGTGLGAFLNTTVEVGTGGSFADCAGFAPSASLFTGTLDGLAAAHSNYANGLGGFPGATAGTSRTYRISVTLADDNAAQGKNANATFTWEAQNL